MSSKKLQKKPASWSKNRVISVLHDAQISLAQLSLKNGKSAAYCANAFIRPNETAQALIAMALQTALQKLTSDDSIAVHPSEIWPDRYDSAGNYTATSASRKPMTGPVYDPASLARNTQLAKAA